MTHVISEREKKALEALNYAMGSGLFICHSKDVGVGQIVLRMSDELREHLKGLKSDDLKNLRPYWIQQT